MTTYEGNGDGRGAKEAPSDAKKEGGKGKKGRLSPFEPRIALWLVVPADAPGGEDGIFYAAPTKKLAYRAVAALAMRRFMPHYSMWLPLHGHPSGEPGGHGIDSDAWAEYVAANGEAVNGYLSTLCICRARYDRHAVAALVRMLCGAAPLGIGGETGEEVGYWLAQADAEMAAESADAEMAERERAVREAEARLAAKEGPQEKTPDPLDKPADAEHNGGAKKKKEGEAAPRKKAAPRRKGATENGNGKDGDGKGA